MKAVYQRFCTCGASKGFTIDPDRKLWVCAACGYPTEAWYLGTIRSGKIPPPLHGKKWGTPSPVRNIQNYKVIVQHRAAKARAKADRHLTRRSTERGSRRAK